MLHEGPLKELIIKEWGTYDAFVVAFNTATAGIQGSGWGWVVRSS